MFSDVVKSKVETPIRLMAGNADRNGQTTKKILQATALGLSAHQAGGIEKDKIRASYNVPDDTDILVAFGLGYQADESVLPDDLAEREKTPRARKSLSDIVYTGAYGEKMRF